MTSIKNCITLPCKSQGHKSDPTAPEIVVQILSPCSTNCLESGHSATELPNRNCITLSRKLSEFQDKRRIGYTKIPNNILRISQKVDKNWSTKAPNQSAECYKVNSTLKSHKVNKLIDKSAKSRAPNLKFFKPHQIVSKLRRI